MHFSGFLCMRRCSCSVFSCGCVVFLCVVFCMRVCGDDFVLFQCVGLFCWVVIFFRSGWFCRVLVCDGFQLVVLFCFLRCCVCFFSVRVKWGLGRLFMVMGGFVVFLSLCVGLLYFFLYMGCKWCVSRCWSVCFVFVCFFVDLL